ncbi:hypothetical protein DSM107007_27610 [Nostoc sp. PCC 7120 = FACHB-418]|nr:hypothetical protein DSM107007_27610 [Nostoc sp. PCC 7120 = FACHB-418]
MIQDLRRGDLSTLAQRANSSKYKVKVNKSVNAAFLTGDNAVATAAIPQ